MAAAAFYLASFLGGYRDCWPAHLETLTGLTLKDFAEPLESLYLRSFCSEPVRDHRGVALSSVYDRYVKRTQENMIPNLFPAAPPSLSALQEAISSKLQVCCHSATVAPGFLGGQQEAKEHFDLAC